MKLSLRARNIVPSATIALSARVSEMQKQGIDVLKLNIGEPDFPPPAHLCDEVKRAASEPFSKYTPVTGIPELREAIAKKLREENNIPVQAGHVCASTGAKQALQNALLALCDPGDEVILPVPCWVSYSEMIRMTGADPVFVPVGKNFSLLPDKIEEAITSHTKAVLICSPNNPTGAVYPRDILLELASIAERHGIAVISDEIYERIFYDIRPVSIASLNESALAHTVTVNGFSKSFAMPGWRLGYSAATGKTAEAIAAIQGHMTSAPNSLAQRAGAVALTASQQCVSLMREEYRKRRDAGYALIKKMDGIDIRRPDGAFYFFPDVRGLYGKTYNGHPVTSSADLATVLLEVAHVATVPGEAFFAPGYMRLSYATECGTLKEALQRIGDTLTELR